MAAKYWMPAHHHETRKYNCLKITPQFKTATKCQLLKQIPLAQINILQNYLLNAPQNKCPSLNDVTANVLCCDPLTRHGHLRVSQ